MKQVYPIVLSPAEEGGFVVSVPDLNIGTQGESIAEAIEMARDAISLWGVSEEDAGRSIPDPSRLDPEHATNDIVTLVDVDFTAYRRVYDRRVVRRNVTLPSWLNELGEQNGVNFSQVLQEGLKAKLNIEDR